MTWGEMTYAVLDLLKEHADDAFYTEEHVQFLLSNMRTLLLERKYKQTRNSVFSNVSDENKQWIDIPLDTTEILPYGCSGIWLKSVNKLPHILKIHEPQIATVSDMVQSQVTFIPAERMPYVGKNKWLRNIIYAARSANGFLYLTSVNAQFKYLEKVRMTAVFTNALEAAKLSCCPNERGECDILNLNFPLEQSLIPSCIEMVVQELSGSRYAPEDKTNNAKDDLGDANVTTPETPKPAENTTYKREEE